MLVVVDIDGTIADHSDRLRNAGGPFKDRDDPKAFQAWLNVLQPFGKCEADPVIESTRLAVWSLASGVCGQPNDVVFVTGRSEILRAETDRWLRKNSFPEGSLVMRAANDFRSAHDYKKEAM